MELIIGTSGFDYKDWIGQDRFYPPSVALNKRDLLTYYASKFAILELNFTYYTETTATRLADMLKRVHPENIIQLIDGTIIPKEDFKFSIKAYRRLTHEIDENSISHAKKFVGDIAPLIDAGKLAAILLQFPPSFRPTGDTLDYLRGVREVFSELPLVFEFRYKRWFAEDTVRLLRNLNVAFCWVDAPVISGLPRKFFPLTADFAYARFHGRNEVDWWGGTQDGSYESSSRYHYLYSTEELSDLAQAVVQSGAKKAYILFNNHPVADAPKNARQFELIANKLLSNA